MKKELVIVIGKGGSMLRKIGQEARADLEDFFQIKVNLQWLTTWRFRELHGRR